MVIGTITTAMGALETPSGIKFQSGVATYTPAGGAQPGEWKEIPAISCGALWTNPAGVEASFALINLHGFFGDGPSGPYMADLRFQLDSNRMGWEFVRLEAEFKPLPSPTLESERPWAWFDGEVVFVCDDPVIDRTDDAKVIFRIGVTGSGALWVPDARMDYGRCEIHYGSSPKLELIYNEDKHG